MSGRRRCTATSKRSGSRCGRAPIVGGHVCRFHGGASPQAQKTARERLALLAEPALEALGDLVVQKKSVHARLAAARDILDRTHGRAPQFIEVTETPSATYLRHVPADRLATMRTWIAEAKALEAAEIERGGDRAA